MDLKIESINKNVAGRTGNILIILSIIVLIISFFIYSKKTKNKYNNFKESEKEIFEKAKLKVKNIKIICIIVTLLCTIILSTYHFYNRYIVLENFEEKEVFEISSVSSYLYESEGFIVIANFSTSILLGYLIFLILLKVNKKISSEERKIIREYYTGTTAIIIIQFAIIFIFKILSLILLPAKLDNIWRLCVIILGIDPGFGRIGYGIIDFNKNQYKIIEYGCITTPENSYFPRRLNKIEEDLETILSKHTNIDVASIEDLYFNTNITTAIKVAQARGVILNTLSKHNIDIYEYTPIQAKQAIAGYGRANKHQVMEMLKKFLKMENMPKLDDTADALALAICHTQYNRYTEFTGTDKSKKGTMTKLQQIYEEKEKTDKDREKKTANDKKALEKEKRNKKE